MLRLDSTDAEGVLSVVEQVWSSGAESGTEVTVAPFRTVRLRLPAHGLSEIEWEQLMAQLARRKQEFVQHS